MQALLKDCEHHEEGGSVGVYPARIGGGADWQQRAAQEVQQNKKGGKVCKKSFGGFVGNAFNKARNFAGNALNKAGNAIK